MSYWYNFYHRTSAVGLHVQHTVRLSQTGQFEPTVSLFSLPVRRPGRLCSTGANTMTRRSASAWLTVNVRSAGWANNWINTWYPPSSTFYIHLFWIRMLLKWLAADWSVAVFQTRSHQTPSMSTCCWTRSATQVTKDPRPGRSGTASMRRTASSKHTQYKPITHFWIWPKPKQASSIY